jgi:hypothetical protein
LEEWLEKKKIPMPYICSSNMAKKKKTKNPNAVALGRLGGLKGGKARIAQLSPEERRELARKAVQARWAKAKARKEKP